MLSQNIHQCPLWKLPLTINEEVASKGPSSRFSVRGMRFMLGRCSCSLFRLVLNHWRLPHVGRVFGGWQIYAGHGRECAGGWGWGSNPLLPAQCGVGGVCAFHPMAAWMTFPGESGVAVGGTADTSAVTHFTRHSPGHLVCLLMGHQAHFLPPPGQQERGAS